MKSFTPTPSFTKSRAFIASVLTCIILVTPLTPLGFAATTTQTAKSRSTNNRQPVQKAPAPATQAVQATATRKDPPVVPNAISASDISATKVDTIVNDTLGDGKAQAGDTIRYDITITNNSATDPALNVTLNDIIDGNTTLVPNSINAQPQARNDAYTTVGNTLLKVGVAAGTDPEVVVAGNVFSNDANATSTSSYVSNTQPANGTLTFNSDGTFTYLPNANFRGPTDTFTYTVKSDADNTLTDTATVTITITSMVWYVDNSYAGANGAADGRSNRPFTSLTPVNNAAADVDLAGDYIYLFTGNAAYTTGLVLENNQILYGNGVALVVPINATPTTLRAAGSRPTLSNGTGNALTLANSVLAQGLNLTAAANAALFGSSISGTNNVSDMNLTTTGSGTAVSLTNQAGTFNYSGGGGSSISGNSSGKAVLISSGGGNITFFGVPISQNGGGVVDIQGRSGGTVEFSNGSTVTQTAGAGDSVVLRNNAVGSVINFLNNVNLTTLSGRGLQTDNSSGSFTLNMNAAGNNISATGGAAIDVEDIAADLDFVTLSSTNSTAQGIRIFNLSNSPVGRSITVTTSTTVTNSAGTGVLVDSNAAAVSFATLNSAPATGQIGVSIVSNTGATSSTGGTVTATDAVAVNVLNSLVNMTLASVSTDNTGDADRGVSLDGLTGTLVMSGGSIVGGNAQAFFANAQNGSITYNGTISQANAFRLIEVTNKTGGTVAFGGALTATGANSTGIFLNANASTTFNFTAGMNLSTGANAAFTATAAVANGGGTVNITQNNTSIVNTLTTTTGTALNITNTNIGASDLTFRSISSNGGTASGIILNNTGASGGLHVTGNGTAGSGGTIQNKTGANITSGAPPAYNSGTLGTGIILVNTSEVQLDRMQLNNFSNFGIRGYNVNGFTFANSTVNTTAGLNGDDTNQDEGSLSFDNLTGTVSITDSFIEDSLEANARIVNTTGTLNLTVSGSTFRDTSANVTGLQGLLLQSGLNAGDVANITANITTSTFSNNFARGIQAVHNQGGTMEVNIGTATAGSGGTFSSNFSSIDIAHNSSGTTNFNVKNAVFTVSAANAGPPVNIFMGSASTAGSTFMGRVHGNDITGANNQGHAGISVVGSGAGTMTIAITNNIIDQIAQRGIAVAAGQGSNTVNATITGNTVTLADPNSAEAIFATASVNPTDTSTMNATIGGSSAALKNNVSSVGGNEIRAEARFGRTFVLPGYAGGPQDTAAVNAFLAANNTINGGTTSSTVGLAPMGSFVGNPPTPTPTNSNAAAPTSTPDLPGMLSAAPTSSMGTPIVPPTASNNVIGQPFVSLPQVATTAAAAAPQARTTSEKASSSNPDEAQTSKSAADKGGNVVQPLQAAFPVVIPVLQPGESVTITFQVTVNSNIPNNVTSVSNQGSITGNFSGTVLTNDPSTGAANDPTVTEILPRPSYTINNASIQEPSTGSVNMPFTVSLSHAYGSAVSVSFQTADGTATAAGGDYTPTSGTLNFAAGQLVQTISVPILPNGDTSDENFTVTLSSPVNSVLGANSTATGTITELSTPGRVLISEVRTSGPNGAGDDFVELYNNQDVSQNISGWAVFKSGASCLETPVLVAVIPAATTLPPRGHYLIVGPQYNAANFNGTAGNATVAAVADIEADRNLALFNTSNVLSLSTTTREDAVGFAANAGGGNNCDLLREGATLLSASGSTSQYSFARNLITGLPKETNDNAADFLLVSTTPAVNVGDNATPILGAPGPENLASPIQRNAVIKASLVDGTVSKDAPPNRVRSSFGANPTNAAFGTLSIQRRFKNTLGVSVTRLRFRIVDLTTINNRPPGSADLRVLSSTGTVTPSNGVPLPTTYTGLTLEGPPQPNGGGLNSTLTVIPPGGALAAGATIDVQFLLGVQEQGAFSFFVNVEALPAPAGAAGSLPGADLKNGSTQKQIDPAATAPAPKPDDQQ